MHYLRIWQIMALTMPIITKFTGNIISMVFIATEKRTGMMLMMFPVADRNTKQEPKLSLPQVHVNLQSGSVEVRVEEASGQGLQRSVMEGGFPYEVRGDESMWSLVPGEHVSVRKSVAHSQILPK